MNKITVTLVMAAILASAAAINAEEAENQALTAVSGTTISGYVETSMNWQFGDKKTSFARTNNGAKTQNGFNLDAVQIGIGKALAEDAVAWDAGYQVDLIFGEEAESLYCSNLGNQAAIKNAYVDLRAPIGNGLDFRVGVFESIVGYESNTGHENYNYSRSYAYYFQPTQNTGILGSYNFDISDWTLGLKGGIANTYTTGSDLNIRSGNSARLAYMGAVNLIFPDSTGFMEGTEIYFSIANGNNPVYNKMDIPQAKCHNSVALSTGITMPLPIDGLELGFAYDYYQQGAGASADDSVPPPAFNNRGWANTYAAYLNYEATEKLSFANRIEYMNLSGNIIAVEVNEESRADGSYKDGQFIEDTFTISYKLWENVLTRAEFRWDHDLTGNKRMNDECTDNNAFGISGNIVYAF